MFFVRLGYPADCDCGVDCVFLDQTVDYIFCRACRVPAIFVVSYNQPSLWSRHSTRHVEAGMLSTMSSVKMRKIRRRMTMLLTTRDQKSELMCQHQVC